MRIQYVYNVSDTQYFIYNLKFRGKGRFLPSFFFFASCVEYIVCAKKIGRFLYYVTFYLVFLFEETPYTRNAIIFFVSIFFFHFFIFLALLFAVGGYITFKKNKKKKTITTTESFFQREIHCSPSEKMYALTKN